MSVGVSVTKLTGKLIFELERGEDKTTRTIEVPNAITDTVGEETVASLQAAINSMNSFIHEHPYEWLVQPANWRDTSSAEEQWTTNKVSYEVSSVTTTLIEPE